MADEVDKKAFDAMKESTTSKADNLTKGFDWEGYFAKGDSLYSVYADKSISQYNPNFPGISMFDEGGEYTQDYKQTYREAYGKDISPSGVRGQTPRQAYFSNMFGELEDEFRGPRNAKQDIEDQRTRAHSFDPYGNFMIPRYSGDKLISPYKAAKVYRESIAGKGTKDIQAFEKNVYRPYLKGLSTKE